MLLPFVLIIPHTFSDAYVQFFGEKAESLTLGKEPKKRNLERNNIKSIVGYPKNKTLTQKHRTQFMVTPIHKNPFLLIPPYF